MRDMGSRAKRVLFAALSVFFSFTAAVGLPSDSRQAVAETSEQPSAQLSYRCGAEGSEDVLLAAEGEGEAWVLYSSMYVSYASAVSEPAVKADDQQPEPMNGEQAQTAGSEEKTPQPDEAGSSPDTEAQGQTTVEAQTRSDGTPTRFIASPDDMWMTDEPNITLRACLGNKLTVKMWDVQSDGMLKKRIYLYRGDDWEARQSWEESAKGQTDLYADPDNPKSFDVGKNKNIYVDALLKDNGNNARIHLLRIRLINDPDAKPLSTLNLCAAVFGESEEGPYARPDSVKYGKLYIRACHGLFAAGKASRDLLEAAENVRIFELRDMGGDRLVDCFELTALPRLSSGDCRARLAALAAKKASPEDQTAGTAAGETIALASRQRRRIDGTDCTAPFTDLVFRLQQSDRRLWQRKPDTEEELQAVVKGLKNAGRVLAYLPDAWARPQIDVTVDGRSLTELETLDIGKQTFALVARVQDDGLQEWMCSAAEKAALAQLSVEVRREGAPTEKPELTQVEAVFSRGDEEACDFERRFQLDVGANERYAIIVKEKDDIVYDWSLRSRDYRPITINDTNGGWANVKSATEGFALSGSAEPNTLIDLVCAYSDGNTDSVRVKADGEGNWEQMLAPDTMRRFLGRASGTMTLSASYVDASINERLSPAQRTFEMDMVAPDVNTITYETDTQIADAAVWVMDVIKADVALRGQPIRLRVHCGDTDCHLVCVGEAEETTEIEPVEDAEEAGALYAVSFVGDSAAFAMEDAAGNRSEALSIAVQWIEHPAISDPAESFGAKNWAEANVLSGTSDAFEKLEGEYWLDGNATDAKPLAIEMDQTGEGGWHVALPAECADGTHTLLNIRLSYADLPFATAEGEWPLDFQGPSIDADKVNAIIEGIPGEPELLHRKDDVLELYFLDNTAHLWLNAEQAVQEPEAAISYLDPKGHAMPDGEYSGMLKDDAEAPTCFTIVASDAMENQNELTVVAKRAAEVTVDESDGAPCVSFTEDLLLSGTAQPGWQLSFYPVINQIQQSQPLKANATADKDGRWSVRISAQEIDKALTKAGFPNTDNLALLVDYARVSGTSGIAAYENSESKAEVAFEFDRSVALSVEPVKEGERSVRGKTNPRTIVRLETLSDGTTRDTISDDEGSFTFETEPVRIGEQYRVYPVINDEGRLKQAVEIVVGDSNAQLELEAPEISGDSLAIRGIALEGYTVVLMNGDDELDRKVAGAEGAFELQTHDLPEGDYELKVSYEDISVAQSVAVSIDLSGPALQLPETLRDTDTGLSGRLNEAATVTATLYNADGERLDSVSADCSGGDFTLELPKDLSGAAYALVDAVDAANNPAEQQRLNLERSAMLVGSLAMPEPDGRLDCTKIYRIEGWVAAVEADQKPDVRLIAGDEALQLELRESPEKLEELRQSAGAAGFFRVNAATCWTFETSLNLWDDAYSTGPLTLRLEDGDKALVSADWEGECGATLELQVVRKSSTQVKYIVAIVALIVALCAALASLWFVTRKIKKLRDAVVDHDSRNSNLTIRSKT